MPFDRELDQYRVLEALSRGWVIQAQVDWCATEAEAEGAPVLEVLLRKGLLTETQCRQLAERDSGAEPEDPEEETFAPGELINNRYRVLRPFRGGFGRAYLCTDTASGNRCALRTLGREHLGSAPILDRFRDEILLWIGLGDHPNIVLAVGLEVAAGLPFVVMEAVEGGSLAERLAQGPLGWQTAASFGWQIANGLEYAGQVCSLLHRDVKPANLLVTREGVAKVSDFGVSLVRGLNALGDDGTPQYMAPEQWSRSAEVDVRSDVYAFGVTLFELATGRLPFPSASDATTEQLCQIHLREVPQDPRQWEPRMPEPVARLILRCLEKRPKDRPENFAVVRRALEPFAGAQRQAPSYTPSRVGGLVNQSSTYHLLGRQEDAERTARNAVQLDGRSVKARIVLANALAQRHAYPQALGHLEEAHRLAPADPAPIVNSALYASLGGDRNRALHWLEIALATLPARQLEGLTSMLIDLGRIPEAIEICEKIVAEAPDAIMAWNGLSIGRRRLGEFDKALACADQTVNLNPRYARGWSNRATILVQLGQLEEAVSAADKALQFEPTMAGAYAAKAAALGQMGRMADGRECVLAGLGLLPGNPLLERALQQFVQPA